MSIVVNQELGPPLALNRLIFKLETDAPLSMRPDTYNKRSIRPEKRKIWIRQDLPITQMCRLHVGSGAAQNRRHIQQTH